jgi:hypothetical protein
MFKPSEKLELTYNTWELMLKELADADDYPTVSKVEQFKVLTKVLLTQYIDESFRGDSLNDDCEQFGALIKQIKPMIEFAAA